MPDGDSDLVHLLVRLHQATPSVASVARPAGPLLPGRGDELALYAEASGRAVDEAAIRLYRMCWQLDDISVRAR